MQIPWFAVVHEGLEPRTLAACARSGDRVPSSTATRAPRKVWQVNSHKISGHSLADSSVADYGGAGVVIGGDRQVDQGVLLGREKRLSMGGNV
jgi:hypothetical protein